MKHLCGRDLISILLWRKLLIGLLVELRRIVGIVSILKMRGWRGPKLVIVLI